MGEPDEREPLRERAALAMQARDEPATGDHQDVREGPGPDVSLAARSPRKSGAHGMDCLDSYRESC